MLDNLTRSRLCGSDRESIESDWRFLSQVPGVRLVKVYVSDVGRIQDALGWQPKISLAGRLSQLVQWAEQHRELF